MLFCFVFNGALPVLVLYAMNEWMATAELFESGSSLRHLAYV